MSWTRFWLYWIATWFWMLETKHYGWNFSAQSDGEMICDGIALLLLVIAISYKDSKRIPGEGK